MSLLNAIGTGATSAFVALKVLWLPIIFIDSSDKALTSVEPASDGETPSYNPEMGYMATDGYNPHDGIVDKAEKYYLATAGIFTEVTDTDNDFTQLGDRKIAVLASNIRELQGVTATSLESLSATLDSYGNVGTAGQFNYGVSSFRVSSNLQIVSRSPDSLRVTPKPTAEYWKVIDDMLDPSGTLYEFQVRGLN